MDYKLQLVNLDGLGQLFGSCVLDFETYNPGLPNFPKMKLVNLAIYTSIAGVAQWLERHVANVNVVGSNPITRFFVCALLFVI